MRDVHTPKFPFGLNNSENLNFVTNEDVKPTSYSKFLFKKNHIKNSLLSISGFDKTLSPKNNPPNSLTAYFKTAETENERNNEKEKKDKIKSSLRSSAFSHFSPKIIQNFDGKKLFGREIFDPKKGFVNCTKNALEKMGRQFGPARKIKTLNYRYI
jgi:hypothetical protein